MRIEEASGGSGASSVQKVLIGGWEFHSSNKLPDWGGDVSLYAERPYKPPWRATIHALPKNMRKIERRLSLPNRSNGTRKSAGKLTISRGADGAEAGVGKMIGRICRVELAVCNLNRLPCI